MAGRGCHWPASGPLLGSLLQAHGGSSISSNSGLSVLSQLLLGCFYSPSARKHEVFPRSVLHLLSSKAEVCSFTVCQIEMGLMIEEGCGHTRDIVVKRQMSFPLPGDRI